MGRLRKRRPDPATADLFEWDQARQAAAAEHNARRHAAFRKEGAMVARREREQRGTLDERRQQTKAGRRLQEIGRLIALRHGLACDTDDGPIYLAVALPSIIREAGGPGSRTVSVMAEGWRARWVPLVDPSEALEMAADLERAALAGDHIHLRAGPAGDRLRLTMEERMALAITSIRPAGMSGAELKRLARDRDNAKKRARREAAGATPHARSKSALKPWVEAGISRTVWYEREKARTNSVMAGLRSSPVLPPNLSAPPEAPPVEVREKPRRQRRTLPASGGHWQHAEKAFAESPMPAQSVRRGTARPLEIDPEAPPASLSDLGLSAADLARVESELGAYAGGRLTEPLAAIVLAAMQRRAVTKAALARLLGVNPPQVVRALNGSRGLSLSVAANLKRWLCP